MLNMVYVVKKFVHNKGGNYYTYLELCKSVRSGKKVKRIFIKHLGKIKGYSPIKERDIKKLFLEYNNCCAICKSKENLTIDHIIPRSKGGLNVLDNLQILCKGCNNKKYNKDGIHKP